MTVYDAVVFDNDGVLVEPPAYETQADATRSAFRSAGVEAVDPDHVDDIVTGVTVDRLEEICDYCGIDPEQFWQAREDHDDRSQRRAFRAGRRDRYGDVSALRTLEQDLGVVSNNHQTTVEFVLEFFGLESLFDTVYGREMSVGSLRRKKPDPHYLDLALDDLDAGSALYVGDSPGDVLAAERAGVDSAFVTRSHNRGEFSVSPTYRVADLHEVVEVVSGKDRRTRSG